MQSFAKRYLHFYICKVKTRHTGINVKKEYVNLRCHFCLGNPAHQGFVLI